MSKGLFINAATTGQTDGQTNGRTDRQTNRRIDRQSKLESFHYF